MSEQRYPFTVTAGNHGIYDAKGNPVELAPGGTVMLTFAEAATKPWVKPAPGTPTPPAAAAAQEEVVPEAAPPPPAPTDAEGFGDWTGFLDSHNVNDARAKIAELKDPEQLAALLAAEKARETPRKGVTTAATERLGELGFTVQEDEAEEGEEV